MDLLPQDMCMAEGLGLGLQVQEQRAQQNLLMDGQFKLEPEFAGTF
jgi:hypothetical protein